MRVCESADPRLCSASGSLCDLINDLFLVSFALLPSTGMRKVRYVAQQRSYKTAVLLLDGVAFVLVTVPLSLSAAGHALPTTCWPCSATRGTRTLWSRRARARFLSARCS